MMKQFPLVKQHTFTFLFPLALLLVLFSSTVKKGISAGLTLCAEALIPSLFPFLCLCFTLLPFAGRRKSLAAALFSRLFHLPRESAAVFFLAMLGGYPTGILMTEAFLKEQRLSAAEAKRMSLFCCSAGPAFSVIAVGEGICGSKETGLMLFAANVLAQLLIGLFLSAFARKEAKSKGNSLYKNTPDFSEALTAGVEKGVRATLLICAYVLLFSAVLELLRLLPLPQEAAQGIAAVLEVTNGCLGLRKEPALLAAVLGFGGLSVFFQLKGALQQIGTPAWQFLLSRAASAGLSAGICRLLLFCFPQAIPTLAQGTSVRALSFSAPLSALLLLSFALLVMDNKKLEFDKVKF